MVCVLMMTVSAGTNTETNMCRIVGIVGQQSVSERLVDALERLQYRGYDSTGVATIVEGTCIAARRGEARQSLALSGTIGMSHMPADTS